MTAQRIISMEKQLLDKGFVYGNASFVDMRRTFLTLCVSDPLVVICSVEAGESWMVETKRDLGIRPIFLKTHEDVDDLECFQKCWFNLFIVSEELCRTSLELLTWLLPNFANVFEFKRCVVDCIRFGKQPSVITPPMRFCWFCSYDNTTPKRFIQIKRGGDLSQVAIDFFIPEQILFHETLVNTCLARKLCGDIRNSIRELMGEYLQVIIITNDARRLEKMGIVNSPKRSNEVQNVIVLSEKYAGLGIVYQYCEALVFLHPYSVMPVNIFIRDLFMNKSSRVTAIYEIDA